MLKTYITKLKLNGIKNIDEEITLDFYNNITSNKVNINKSNIKGIYGPNGSGKSGIIHAIEIYIGLNTSKNFIENYSNKEYINHLINYKTKKLDIEIEFISYDNENTIETHGNHYISLTSNLDGEISVSNERYQTFKVPKNKKTKNEIVYEVINGQIISTIFDDTLLEKTKNLLKDKTLLQVIFNDILKNEENEQFENEISILKPLIVLNASTKTVTDDNDQHNFYLYKLNLQKITDKVLPIEKENNYSVSLLSLHSDRIKTDRIEHYKNQINDLTNFIKIFKPNLINIELQVKEDKDTYLIEKVFKYKDYKIHIEFESAGIKKLVSLFSYFRNLVRYNQILFIDELDSKINDVYLIKLIEYFNEYLDGQLIFTTHNVGPMEILRTRKHSIDFISSKGRLTSWASNGNYNVINLYRKGMIKNLPFNVESFDFLAGLGEKTDE